MGWSGVEDISDISLAIALARVAISAPPDVSSMIVIAEFII
jgi:hypothetical protein